MIYRSTTIQNEVIVITIIWLQQQPKWQHKNACLCTVLVDHISLCTDLDDPDYFLLETVPRQSHLVTFLRLLKYKILDENDFIAYLFSKRGIINNNNDYYCYLCYRCITFYGLGLIINSKYINNGVLISPS